MNNQLQILIKILKKKKLTKIALLTNLEKFYEFDELILSKSWNFVEDCQPTKNLLGSLAHPFGGSLAHLFFFGSLAHPFNGSLAHLFHFFLWPFLKKS